MNPLSSNRPLLRKYRPSKKIRHLKDATPVSCPPSSPELPKINLNLNVRPNINGKIDQNGDNLHDIPPPPGWNGNEYTGPPSFLNLGMYNGGKNNDPNEPRIGQAFVAYDCNRNTLCVAAYMNDVTIFGLSPNCTIVQSSASTWVSISKDDDNSNTVKYKE